MSYYKISNPNLWNTNTGFVTIPPRYYEKFDKDYVFDYVIPSTGEHIHKIISKEFVRDNAIFGKNSDRDRGYVSKEYKSYAYRISIDKLVSYPDK